MTSRTRSEDSKEASTPLTAGTPMPARIPITAIVTSSSGSENPRCFLLTFITNSSLKQTETIRHAIFLKPLQHQGPGPVHFRRVLMTSIKIENIIIVSIQSVRAGAVQDERIRSIGKKFGARKIIVSDQVIKFERIQSGGMPQ